MQAADTTSDIPSDIPLAAESVGEVLAAHGVNSLRSRVLTWLGATPSNLPEGLLLQVELQRQKSELTIGWLQLVIVLVLGMLYFSLPTASPAADLPSFVPLLMVAYTAFAAV